ncbi:DUF6193 family natural product biosynthesis protein [Streptomyces sp. HUAS TT3]|uniref:DUF6193 family natural product biosynthesis protein n=1 Tax=Streptomyces sp. HUAS TT3 TaxID=3447510 RepID=UPI003F65DDE1
MREPAAQGPFVEPAPLSEAYERGEGVEARWRQLRADRAPGQQGEGLHALVEAAFATPRLRAPSPDRSMCWLRFSRRVTPPGCTDLPWIRALGNGRHEVRTADGRVRETGGAAETVALAGRVRCDG